MGLIDKREAQKTGSGGRTLLLVHMRASEAALTTSTVSCPLPPVRVKDMEKLCSALQLRLNEMIISVKSDLFGCS